MSSTNVEKIELQPPQADTVVLDIELAKPREQNGFATDFYEILRVSPQADVDTIERVYQTLAERFHPDNPGTGDPQTFLQLREAYETLSDPARRAEYNVSLQHSTAPARFRLQSRDFFNGVRGARNRRLAILCLLYRKRTSNHDRPGLTILDLEKLTGCTREEITSALWYLCEKDWAALGEFTAYSITIDGFDFVERTLENRMEFRALASWCYYSVPDERDDQARTRTHVHANDTLPFDIEPEFMAAESDEDVAAADHYEALGIAPQADEETIERVYRTLEGRFHPDNPVTGDAKAFQRIREAWETLSDQARREEYDAVRQGTRHSERFRLRGREFFEGIRGEQLRRMAVLCLLYRDATNEGPGLTVLDLEQSTGCTREELGSALWYVREKKWAKSGQFTQYSITAAGFDVIEKKLDEREAAISRARLDPGEAREFDHPQISAAIPVTPHYLAGDTVLSTSGIGDGEPEIAESVIEVQALDENVDSSGNSHRIAESTQTDVDVSRSQTGAGRTAASGGLKVFARRLLGRSTTQGSAEQLTTSQDHLLPAPAAPIDERAGVAEPGARLEDGIERQEPEAESTSPPPGETAGYGPIANEVSRPDSVTPQNPGVRSMNHSTMAITNQPIAEQPVSGHPGRVAVNAEKRVIFSMGGKGGVGKTSVMTVLAEWFEDHQIPAKLLDLDTENKACGSLTHFFGGRVPKINIYTPAGLDAFIDILGEAPPVILADMGAGAGQVTHDWFEKMYPDVSEAGVVFTAVGVVTSDPASVDSVLHWAAALEKRVDYVIVENNISEHPDFAPWRESERAEQFRNRYQPAILRMDYRLAELENAARSYGVTLSRVVNRTAGAAELQRASLVMRAQSYRRRMFAEFDRVKELLLP